MVYNDTREIRLQAGQPRGSLEQRERTRSQLAAYTCQTPVADPVAVALSKLIQEMHALISVSVPREVFKHPRTQNEITSKVRI